MACVLDVFIAPDKGVPMERKTERVRVLAGVGIEGDRYAAKRGAFSASARVTVRHVSLIEIEAIMEANREVVSPFTPAETRRNIVTLGIRLNDLVGKTFRVNGILMRGIELCAPCARPSQLSGKKGFEAAFDHRGGLRAEVLEDGTIGQGDLIEIDE